MAEFRRAPHRRIADILARMDGKFLAQAKCYFGGGTQLALAHGEFRESRDIDFLVSAPAGIRKLRETTSPRSLGRIFKGPIVMVRELISDHYAMRSFITEDRKADPIKFEIVYEGRIRVNGRTDAALGVPTLSPSCAVAEKLLANADRGLDKVFRSRDAIDLAFVCVDLDDATFRAGYQMAERVYGASILRSLGDVIKRLELDAKFRSECLADLMIDNQKGFREGLARLKTLRRGLNPGASLARRSRI